MIDTHTHSDTPRHLHGTQTHPCPPPANPLILPNCSSLARSVNQPDILNSKSSKEHPAIESLLGWRLLNWRAWNEGKKNCMCPPSNCVVLARRLGVGGGQQCDRQVSIVNTSKLKFKWLGFGLRVILIILKFSLLTYKKNFNFGRFNWFLHKFCENTLWNLNLKHFVLPYPCHIVQSCQTITLNLAVA